MMIRLPPKYQLKAGWFRGRAGRRKDHQKKEGSSREAAFRSLSRKGMKG